MSQYRGIPSIARVSRRHFLRRAAGAGLGAAALSGCGAANLGSVLSSSIVSRHRNDAGDVAMLKFLAAAELIEQDFWEQYCELAMNNDGYREALEKIDEAMVRYICDNTDDERSHAAFLNAYLDSIGEDPVNLDAFRTLPSVRATGAENKGRLTNLTSLTVDTSWYNRYRQPGNPDFGDSFERETESPDYFQRFSVPAYEIASDVLLYAFTH